MKRKLTYLAALGFGLALALNASGQGIERPLVNREQVIWSFSPSTAFANTTDEGGIVLPADTNVTLTAMSLRVTSASGGGAGNTVLTATDGTNSCTFTFPCTGSTGTDVIPRTLRQPGVGAGGTGCFFAAGAKIAATVTTAGCTTTQPTARTLTVHGKWQ